MSKRPVAKSIANSHKVPRVESPRILGKPSWRVGRLDFNSPWCPKNMNREVLFQVCERLKSFEGNTWAEIGRGGSHFVNVEHLIKDAQKRLSDLKLEDLDQLYSLRVSGKERLWGIVSNDVFTALWWDPEHQICPAPLKHT